MFIRRGRRKPTRGCRNCLERRKKCDQKRPTCEACSRLEVICYWPSDIVNQNSDTSNVVNLDEKSLQLIEHTSRRQIHQSDTHIASYDDPSILQGSATSTIRSVDDKAALLYLCEVGAQIIRYPTQLSPGYVNINSFRLGFQMASNSPPHIQTLVAIGAAHLGKTQERYRSVALQNYGRAMISLQHKLRSTDSKNLPEWTSAVAALLGVYQLVVFDSGKERLAHLSGFFRLCEARIAAESPWGPLQILMEHYTHSFVINSLFHFGVFTHCKPIEYADQLVQRLNRGPRPLGRAICGVPEMLITAAYKLVYLLHKDVRIAPWGFELHTVSVGLRRWEFPVYTRKPEAVGLWTIAQLYHSACHCLLEYLETSTGFVAGVSYEDHIKHAVTIVRASALLDKPFNSITWPLIVLCIFAEDPMHRIVLIGPLEALRDRIRLKAYGSAVDCIRHIWATNLGTAALHQPDALSMVCI